VNKRAESIKALREMNDAELAEHLRVQRRKLFEIRFQQATGQVENHRQVRAVRREIARTMTVQIEAERLLSSPTVAPPPAAAPVATPARRRGRGKVEPVEEAEPAETVEAEAAAAEEPAAEAADEGGAAGEQEVDEDE
jgi:large subunit ribosomal protein L29